jgi:hypothetical protein
MRISTALKVVAMSAAVVLVVGVPNASARMKRHPPDACLFHRHYLAAGTLCSYDCNPNTLGCSQQICSGGHWSAALPCPRPFCTQRCG